MLVHGWLNGRVTIDLKIVQLTTGCTNRYYNISNNSRIIFVRLVTDINYNLYIVTFYQDLYISIFNKLCIHNIRNNNEN